MQRRQILQAGMAAASMAAFSGISRAQQASASNAARFKLKYAPHFGMFRHHAGNDPIDQLKFIADQGFRALEDNGMMGRDAALQESIGKEMSRLDLEMGVFVADADFGGTDWSSNKQEIRDAIKSKMQRAVECAKRVNAKWCTVVPGLVDQGMQPEFQMARIVDNLKYAAEVCEPHGLVMVLEPLNPWINHPGLYLQRIPQAYMVCKAVGSPSCKILDDLYHQQITEGNLIPNLNDAWDEIAYFQVGDNPGRNEPTTGEINYLNIFKHLHDRGYDGIIGMEHGNSRGGKEGEQAVIDAYRTVDSFEV